MKPSPKQEQATLQIASAQPCQSGGQCSPSCETGCRLWFSSLPEACVRYKRATASVPGDRFGSLCFLPLGPSYTSRRKCIVGSDLGNLGTGMRLVQER